MSAGPDIVGSQVMVDPAFGISVRTILDKDGRREIVFQMPVPLNASVDFINGMLDRVTAAVDRQIAKYDLREAEKEAEVLEEFIPKVSEQFERITSAAAENWAMGNRRGEFDPQKHISAGERQTMNQLIGRLEGDRERLLRLRGTIARLKPLVHGNGLDIGADSHA